MSLADGQRASYLWRTRMFVLRPKLFLVLVIRVSMYQVINSCAYN